jgi:hypothetical protein
MRFEVFTAVKMWIAIWDVMLCNLIGSYHRFGGTYHLHPQGRSILP